MGTDRTWTLTSRRDDDGGLLWSICAASQAPRDTTEWIPVVEVSRLREVEAELVRLEAENREYQVRVTTAEADAESAFQQRDQAEAELREAREALADAIALVPDLLSSYESWGPTDTTPVDAERWLDRARGVLEEGDKG